MVDDGSGVPRRDTLRSAPRLVDLVAGQCRELRHPAADVVAVGIELPALAGRVEDPEVRRRVRPRPCRPLPAVLVAGQVAVDQVVHEVSCAAGPDDVQILHEERRGDHPHPVVHPAFFQELAHPSIDEWKAGPTGGPRMEPAIGGSTVVVVHTLHVWLEGGPCARGCTVEHGGVELPPRQLTAKIVVVRSEIMQERARVDRAELEERRHARGAIEGWVVASLAVAHQVVRPEPRPRAAGGELSRGWQRGRDRWVVGDVNPGDLPPLDGVAIKWGGRAQPLATHDR